jgi:Family of unknown function (DUF6328)
MVQVGTAACGQGCGAGSWLPPSGRPRISSCPFPFLRFDAGHPPRRSESQIRPPSPPDGFLGKARRHLERRPAERDAAEAGRPQLRRAAAGTAGRADRRADPVRVPARTGAHTHRLLFQRGFKCELVRIGHRFAIAGLCGLLTAMVGGLLLVLEVFFGGYAAVVTGAALAALFASLWVGPALWVGNRHRREHLPGQPPAVATAAPTATSGNPAAPRLRGTWICDETGRPQDTGRWPDCPLTAIPVRAAVTARRWALRSSVRRKMISFASGVRRGWGWPG